MSRIPFFQIRDADDAKRVVAKIPSFTGYTIGGDSQGTMFRPNIQVASRRWEVIARLNVRTGDQGLFDATEAAIRDRLGWPPVERATEALP